MFQVNVVMSILQSKRIIICIAGLKHARTTVIAWLYLAEIQLRMHRYEETISSCRQGWECSNVCIFSKLIDWP